MTRHKPTRRIETTACPHCGNPVALNAYVRHVDRCPSAPDMHDRIRAMLDDGAGGIISRHEYEARNVDKELASSTLLERFCGGWVKVAEYFDLIYRPKQGRWASDTFSETTQERREREEIAAFLRTERIAPRGLQAYMMIETEREVRYVLR